MGTYLVPKDGRVKYGLWEDGKRIEWFTEAQVSSIQNRELDYTQIFLQNESRKMVDSGTGFGKPKQFEERLKEVKRRIAQLAM